MELAPPLVVLGLYIIGSLWAERSWDTQWGWSPCIQSFRKLPTGWKLAFSTLPGLYTVMATFLHGVESCTHNYPGAEVEKSTYLGPGTLDLSGQGLGNHKVRMLCSAPEPWAFNV